MIWVNKGLLADVSDDELACVLGHELVHYTHEHARRKARNAGFVQLTAVATKALLDRIDSTTGAAVTAIGAELALDAWRNGYGRSLEDQADRVGLRYAYEGGFDVRQGPQFWRREATEHSEPDRVTNFFGFDHSRDSDRAKKP